MCHHRSIRLSLGDIENLKKISQPWKKNLRQKEGEKAALESELSKLKKENANLKSMLEANKDELTKDLISVKAKLSEKEQKIKRA